MTRITWAIHGQTLATLDVEQPSLTRYWQTHPHDSIAFFCPKCSEIWGRIQVHDLHEEEFWDTPSGQREYWHINRTMCAQHGDGIMWDYGDRNYELYCPVQILAEQFLQELER